MFSQSELLQWGILNKSETVTKIDGKTIESNEQDAKESTPAQKLDSKWIDIILGRSDTVRMKELLVEIDNSLNQDTSNASACEELEGFIQSIDNANDLKPIGAWPIIMKALENPKFTRDILWIIGTSLQNNPKCQGHFMEIHGMNTLLKLEPVETKMILKLLRCFSALLQHNSDNLKMFYEMKGFEKFLCWIGTEDVRHRLLFIYKVLVQEFPIVAVMLSKTGWIDALYEYKEEEVVEFLLLVYSVNASAVRIESLHLLCDTPPS